MVSVIADNIISPLGMTSAENFSAVASGKSALALYDGHFGEHEPFVASLFDRDRTLSECDVVPSGMTFFETLLVNSISMSLSGTDVDPKSPETGYVISSIKGNVELLGTEDSRVPVSASAQKIAEYFGNPNVPVVVSNACISGLTALIHAKRLLETERFRNVVVAGAEVQSLFIVSGFQSLKALSDEPCRPFDRDRKGLNLGEAAASVVLSSVESGRWELLDGATRNDANHISGPSRVGEGSFQALSVAMKKVAGNELAFINVHGTATMYNDEMESIAINRAGLAEVPVNALKGYFGHTMGAAGVLESIVSMRSVENGVIPATAGFENLGVSFPVNVSNRMRPTDRKCFIKLLSGFGGCNAALAFKMR